MDIYIRTVILAFWLGALLAIDVIETPVRVFTSTVPRPYRFAIGSRVFRWFGWAQVLFGAVLMTASTILIRKTGPHSPLQFYGAVTMILLSVVQAIWFGPSMSSRMVVRTTQNTVDLDLRPGFGIFHFLYIGADGSKALLLIWLICKG
jgi:hypothetical protein